MYYDCGDRKAFTDRVSPYDLLLIRVPRNRGQSVNGHCLKIHVWAWLR